MLLTQIYGPLQPKAKTLSAQPRSFSQAEFSPAAAGLASTGYVFIPASCQQAAGRNCAVHVVFHACKQGAETVGGDIYAKVGYNAWADTNGIIVLYPQIDPTTFPSQSRRLLGLVGLYRTELSKPIRAATLGHPQHGQAFDGEMIARSLRDYGDAVDGTYNLSRASL
jgi:hypothetical protein